MKYPSVLSFLLLFTLGCNQQPDAEKGVAPDQSSAKAVSMLYVKTVKLSNTQENMSIDALGVVMSEAEAKPSFKTGGVILKTYFKEGDQVKAGQLLASLNMSEIDAQVQQAEQVLAKAERDLTRAKNLFADSVATLEQVQNATTALDISKRTVEMAHFNRKYSEVRAPISGRVVKQLMHGGEIVGPGMPICAMMGVGNSDWKIKSGLIDRDWVRVKTGAKVSVSFDAFPGKTYEGTVSEKNQLGGNATGNFDITIKLKQNPSELAAGLLAKVKIEPSMSETFTLIPIEALVKTNGSQATAFTIENGKAKKLSLTIAKLMGDHVAIAQGLNGITEIITTGAMYLEEGDLVITQ
jgi:membrane fusion protein, multidrug efflux system